MIKLNDWSSSKVDICRWCSAAAGIWDVSTAYISEAGMKEIYSEMMLDCYGITLCRLPADLNRLVCSTCVKLLHEANTFKNRVMRAEELLQDYCTENGPDEDQVKLENDDEDINQYELETQCRDDMNISQKTDVLSCNKVSSRKRRKIGLRDKGKGCEIQDCDSDTPIAELSRKFSPSNSENKVANANDGTANDTKLHDCSIQVEDATDQPQCKLKPVSERKRIIATCDTVLQHSTACPFRHYKSWFRCFFCPQDFMAMDSLRSHTTDSHKDIAAELKKFKRFPRSLQIDISHLQCRQCQLTLTDVKQMCRHFADVHKMAAYKECIADYVINTSPFACHLCKREFHAFRMLTTHLNEHYANYICDVCGKSFIHSKRLKVHKRTHETGNYPCPHCHRVLKTKASIANHLETHSKRTVKCHICQKPMKHYNHRVKHMSEVHNITHKFTCPICPRVYNIKHYLATHIRQTHGHKNKKCSECGMTFITNHSLKKHMLKHSGLKPFSCQFCLKAYARSYTLKEHMRTHQTEVSLQ